MAAQQAIHFLGMPEGALALAELVVYLALAPKSNAVYRAYGEVRRDVEQTRNDPVPIHLRNAPTGLMKELGYGKGYRYAHDYEEGVVAQQNLPENLAGTSILRADHPRIRARAGGTAATDTRNLRIDQRHRGARMSSGRLGGRGAEELRSLDIIASVAPHAEGSALIKMGNTHVLCTATVEEKVPGWMKGKGNGWVTAEYAMLPRATKQRTQREAVQGKQGGRTVEIQRLIGRSLRSVVNLKALGERQIIVDCDVILADGGTRCASITGGYVAMAQAIRKLREQERISRDPIEAAVAAVSVGVVKGQPLLDIDYSEDSSADVDFNVVMTDQHAFVEIQGTAEKSPFTPATLDELLVLASTGLDNLFEAQKKALARL